MTQHSMIMALIDVLVVLNYCAKKEKKSNQSMQCCIGLHYHLKFVVSKICLNVCLFFERRLVLTKNIVEYNMKH